MSTEYVIALAVGGILVYAVLSLVHIARELQRLSREMHEMRKVDTQLAAYLIACHQLLKAKGQKRETQTQDDSGWNPAWGDKPKDYR
tara:strand:+ start:858 stop:1118 length:261 start_codon:yes stop_codon:yes gene_type:complete